MADDAARYLGFAFASADLLFELDADGVVAFAVGAAQQVAGVDLGALAGSAWREIVAEDDAPIVAAFLASLAPGDRRGPIRIALKPQPGRKLKRYGSLSACRLPQLAPRISCALTLRALGPVSSQPLGPHGLHTSESFTAIAETALKQAAQTGMDLNMELVELAGLKHAADALGQADASAAMQKVAAALRAESIDGASAAELDVERFALLRAGAESSERLTERLSRVISDIGLPSVKPSLDSMELDSQGEPGEGLRALRVALDRFMVDGAAGKGGSLGGMVQKTVDDVSRFKSAVAGRDFTLVYQPVVHLKTGVTHYYEALVRLGGEPSPALAIQMAEEMDLIHDLDLAVVQAVLRELLKPGRERLRLAANVSARSLTQTAFVERLLATLKAAPKARGRLIFEITESAAIDDVQRAGAVVRRLRRDGASVCLDGFGAGASSFDLLRGIAVDQVKIEGRYIRELTTTSGRNTVLVRHLTDLCRELRVATIAGQVESEPTVEILRQIGVDYGQGFLLGRPAADPRPAANRMSPALHAAARR
jgi:EAL domain-containing protein (putative c-di-GMP-specific phosphodiesterase class I)